MIERHVTTALSGCIVREHPEPGSRIELSVLRNRIRAKLLEKPSIDSAKSKEPVVLPVGTKEKIRNLDRKQLIAETHVLVDAAHGRLDRLESERKEAAELLTQINQPGFWDQLNQRDEVLDRYRALDVAIRMQERFARPILHLAELCEDRHSEPTALAAALEQAAVSNRLWEERLAEEGHSEVWMVLGSSDPLKPADEWIRKMANMELAWCRQLGLTATIVAYSVVEHKLNRAVLEIEGPGAENYLSMEQGIHRLHFPQSPDFKIRVELLQNGLMEKDSSVRIQSVRHRRGEFNLMLTCRGHVKLEERGLTVDLLAQDERTLSRLLPDVAASWRRPSTDSSIARIYGKDGVIHDPRTGVTSSRIKDVWKGHLDEFLEAWRRARG
ncbi:hypothetical protein D1AOALGA4SA_10272 [Olavius algarvensis Delta 1 endosymbiont]|nr:hypothetical protein D1AOALGA4SA_10272 [Olavius algarvensis Delta 1 endosymbiont]